MIDLKREAERRLSHNRYVHVVGVVETARAMAALHGGDVEKAEQAAWLHDLYRETIALDMRLLADEVGFALPEGNPVTWHGPLCAARMEKDFGIDDDDVRKAVAYHTVGNPDMPLLARILYVADAIEPNRDFAGVEELRHSASEDLLLALALCADDSIAHLLGRREDISLATVAMRNRAYADWKANQRTIKKGTR